MNKQVKLILLSFLVIGICAVSNFSQTKPVRNVPDYNGTYQGSPGTGYARYTTLYRDNQDDGYRSGCRGEGCGKHPGVDIAVSSGTSVYNPIAGTVEISRCDGSWGGLIVIKSPHPTRYYESIYQIFAHLKTRLPYVGQYVFEGQQIGTSGGNRYRDKCSGNSTGSHLHYQIDKDDGSAEPWYPRSGAVNYSDRNFEVTTRTYNPMVLIQSGYKWMFNGSQNRELWDLFNFQNWGVSGGALWMDGGYDPHIKRGGLTYCGLRRYCSSDIAAEASDYQSVSLDLYNGCPTNYGKIYFTTSLDNRWDENKSIHYYPPWFGSYRSQIYVGWHYKWQGIITGLRIDPAENCNPNGWDPTYFGEISLTR